MCGDLRGASSEVPAPRRQLRGQALRGQALWGTHEETGPRGRFRALEQLHVSLGRRDGSRTAAGGGRRWERRPRPRPPLSRSAETDVPEGGVRSAQAPLSGCPLRAHVLTGACSAPAGPCGRQALLDPALVLSPATRLGVLQGHWQILRKSPGLRPDPSEQRRARAHQEWPVTSRLSSLL